MMPGADRHAVHVEDARHVVRMHGAVTEAFSDLESNVSAALTASALCAALCEA